MLKLCSPTWLTQPPTTWPTSAGSMPGAVDHALDGGEQVGRVDAGQPPPRARRACGRRRRSRRWYGSSGLGAPAGPGRPHPAPPGPVLYLATIPRASTVRYNTRNRGGPAARVRPDAAAAGLASRGPGGSGCRTVADITDLSPEDGWPAHFLGMLGRGRVGRRGPHGERARPTAPFVDLRRLWGGWSCRVDGRRPRRAARGVGRTHRFCGRCGTPTEPAPGDRAMRCPAAGCSPTRGWRRP